MYYSIGGRRPQASDKATRDLHIQRAQLVVLLLYFAFSVCNNFSNRDKTYYEIMGVSRSDDMALMRRVFRQKMLQSHPDKQNSSSPSAEFHDLKEIYEVLNNEVLRLAYDAYDSDVIQTAKKHSSGKRNLSDFFMHYIVGAGSFYIAAFVSLLIHSFINGWSNFFYRNIITLFAMSMELYLTMRPSYFGTPSPKDFAFLAKIPLFMKIDLMRQVALNLGFLSTFMTRSANSLPNVNSLVDRISKSLKKDILKEVENDGAELFLFFDDSDKSELHSKIISNTQLLMNKD